MAERLSVTTLNLPVVLFEIIQASARLIPFISEANDEVNFPVGMLMESIMEGAEGCPVVMIIPAPPLLLPSLADPSV